MSEEQRERRQAVRIAAAVLEAQGISSMLMRPECIEAVLRELRRTGPHVTGQAT
jgi:hypothetical protein